ncbi:MAG: ribonuclease HI family protein [Candidatus Spechtbacterales bacterium]|nr:ribonuclease HI family protein [Candidatus Spechtbacterales bacterium]
MNKVKVYVDGGSRGNPGPAAAGVVLGSPLNKSFAKYLGEATNNEAEYSAVVEALKKIKSLVGKKKTKDMHVEVYMDSQLAVKQLNYEYKIQSDNIIPLFIKVHNLRFDFAEVTFKHIPREKNKDADRMVNIELDKQEGKNSLF